MDVTFDTGSSDLWFNSRNVSMSASSTYKSTNETLELQYAIGYATGTYATDTVAVAGQVIDDFKFGVVTRTSDFSAPMAGLLGMSWPMTNTTSGKNYTDPFWHAAVGGWQDKQFGVYLARNEKTTDQNVAKPITPGGQVTLGGVNTDLFDGDLTYIDLVNATRPAYWAVPLPHTGLCPSTPSQCPVAVARRPPIPSTPATRRPSSTRVPLSFSAAPRWSRRSTAA